MDSNDILNIQEAYMDVYSNSTDQYDLIEDFEMWVESLVNEGYNLSNYTWDDMYGFYLDEAKKDLPTSKMAKQARRKAFNAASETHSDETGIGIVARGDNTARQIRTMARVGGKKVKHHIKKGYEKGRDYDPYYQESYDLYDLVLTHLLDEGYAYNEDAANAIMANMSEEWVDSIVEAEGSYGMTPKAHRAYQNLARKRNKDRRTAGGDTAARHARRTDTRPFSSDADRRRRGMTKADRAEYRGAAEYGSYAYDPEEHGSASGPGGMPKGKKLARQRKRGVSA